MDTLEFQIYDWREDHEFIKPDSDVESDDEDANSKAEYIIRVFGKTIDGKSVYMKMKEFTPYFFIELPEEWDKKKAKGNLKKMFEYLKSDKNTKIFPKKYKEGLIDLQLVEKKKPKGFTNNKIFYFGLLVFDNDISRKKFANLFDPVSYDKNKKVNTQKSKLTIFSISPNPINYPVYEANFPAMLRCFHIQNITGCGWVSVNYKDCNLVEDSDKNSYCNYEFEINWKKVKPIQKDVNAPLVIASFDIECYSSDDQFPQAKRKSDKIIQIGTTYTKLGESVPFRQHIVCLKETDKLDNIIVESYKREEELVKAWIEEIRKSDCDIITGYNIFYFDEKYIYDRCKEILYMDDEDMNFSKLKNYNANFKEMTLASSALGENLLRFWETPGRVHIDLMKDIQNTFKLTSYKLDNVSANFIRGEIKNIELLEISENSRKYKLTCDKLNDLFDDDFIHIELMKSFVSDYVGKKYQIYQLDKTNNNIYIETNIDILNEIEILGKGKLYWSQAKDDVGPKDIFRLQKGSSYDRSIVAKYCVKDCRLVNLLMNKLEIVTKSIEMSNVSYVPMYFLFTRGQGIKLFSLCMKFYRDEGFAFPVIRKPDEDQDKYEGAIVFDPIPSAIYEALSVKDYASLYPSSILHKNMSHETKVIDERYDNLPGVIYYNAYFRESNGKFEYRRFAKVDNQYGVIPKILDFLLKERKRVKKMMKTENEPFKLAILEAKQLAFKLTANSLYGQLGAGTSPVRDRDIAACTTSTGREMLIFAKKYDEEILPWIINGLKYAKINNDIITRDYLLKKEMKDYDNNELKTKIDTLVDVFIKENITIQPIIKYGDSVIGDTPLLLKNIATNSIEIKKINNINNIDNNNIWSNYHNGKESIELDNYMTWTEKGWTKIKRVIRHKLDKNKKLLRIQTNQGIVVVTDEHSLLDKNGKMIDASKVKVGTELLHSFPVENKEYVYDNIVKSIKTDNSEVALSYYYEYKNLGYNVSVDYKKINYCNYYIINILDNQIKLDDKIISITEWEKEEEYVYDLTTENHHFQAGVGSLIVHNTDSVFCCHRYREGIVEVDNKTSLYLWKEIIEFGRDLIKPFISDYQDLWVELFDKYYDLEKITDLVIPQNYKVKEKPTHWKVRLPIEDLLLLFMKEYMEESYLPWLWTLQDLFLKEYNDLDYLDRKTYDSILEIKIFKRGEMLMEKINLVPDDFDSDTKNDIIDNIKNFIDYKLKDYWVQPYIVIMHTNMHNNLEIKKVKFYKGGNKITDKRCMEWAIDLGVISGELVKSRLPPPHDLEYEKTFWPYIILTKKRYVGNKYEFNKNKYKMDFMGIVLKRRDNAPIVKEVCEGIITRLLNDKDPIKAKEFTEKCLIDMVDSKYDIKYFLTSKTLKLKESYADWTRIAHVVLAERIGKRDPGNKPQSGDRIEYAAVCIENETKETLQGDKIETPLYIKENNLQLDYLFYIRNQIMNPAIQFLELAVKNPVDIFNKVIVKLENKKNGQTDITLFLKKKSRSSTKSIIDSTDSEKPVRKSRK